MKILRNGFLLMALMSLAVAGYSDTLVLKDGSVITGYYEGGTSRVIRFSDSTGVREFDLLSVAEIRFGDDVVQSTPSTVVEPAPSTVVEYEPPRLASPEESAQPVRSDTAANTAFTIPRGSSVLVRMVDAIDSEVNRAGETFRATLADPLMLDGLEVVPTNAEVRGEIVEAEGAGRVSGSAELRLQLTRLIVNGITYAIATSEYEEVAEGRGAETGRRVGTAAGVGALIGLIAGGGKGAAIGAGVGAGAAGTVQVLTKGEKLYIPAETLLGFTLSESLSVAAR